MDRILMLIRSHEYIDARNAIFSARKSAAHPEALAFGLSLEMLPDEESEQEMEASGCFYAHPPLDLWTDMERFWQGENYVLMAHPGMRFTAGWDKALLKIMAALHRKAPDQALTCALTGFLPEMKDPIGEVCPVAADAFTREGALTFRHGMPMRHMTQPQPTPFLHPDFCFAPAGFFRAVATGDEPLFLRAFRAGWDLYTLHRPLIRTQWETEVPPASVMADSVLLESFYKRFGVGFDTRELSPQSRRGMTRREFRLPDHFPRSLRLRETWKQWKHDIPQFFGRYSKRIRPQCVTAYTANMPDETDLWLRQMSTLHNLPLTGYVPATLKRSVFDFLPDAYDLQPQHLLELPGAVPERTLPLSKAALLAAARDRLLTPSHYVWMDPDAVRYPVYPGAYLDWQAICTDKIVIAMVGGKPDPSIFAVPQDLVLSLASEMQARALSIMGQRGKLPEEKELWELVIHENPDWFSLHVLPVQGQLFTKICQA